MKPKYIEAIVEHHRCGVCGYAPLRHVGRPETIAEQLLQRPAWPAGELVAIIRLDDLERLLGEQAAPKPEPRRLSRAGVLVAVLLAALLSPLLPGCHARDPQSTPSRVSSLLFGERRRPVVRPTGDRISLTMLCCEFPASLTISMTARGPAVSTTPAVTTRTRVLMDQRECWIEPGQTSCYVPGAMPLRVQFGEIGEGR